MNKTYDAGDSALAVSAAAIGQINESELTQLASDIVPFQSFSGDEAQCARWLGEVLDAEGFEVELIDAEPGRPNVVGRLRGDGSGPSLMFNGHLDVDPVPKNCPYDPWDPVVEDGRLVGHGLWNMKAGVASMAHAAIAIRRSGVPLRGDLIVAGVVGELQFGVGTKALLDRGIIPDLALVPEPSNMNVRTIHCGVFTCLVRVNGESTFLGTTHKFHSVNAVDKMADVVVGLRDLQFSRPQRSDLPPLPRYVIGTIAGGLGEELEMWRPSYVPDTCYITVEVRMPPGMTDVEAMSEIEAVLVPLREVDPELDVEVLPPPAAYRDPWRASRYFMPGIDLDPTDPFPQLLVEHYERQLGALPKTVGGEDPGSCAGTDCGHLTAAGVKSFVFGPTANLKDQSFVELSKLHDHSRVFAAVGAQILCSPDSERYLD